MDLVFIIPVLTIVLLSIYRFFEFKFITHEFKPVKFYIQESVLIFSCSLLSNVIFSNVGSNIKDFFDIITNKKPEMNISGGSPVEIFTENPNF